MSFLSAPRRSAASLHGQLMRRDSGAIECGTEASTVYAHISTATSLTPASSRLARMLGATTELGKRSRLRRRSDPLRLPARQTTSSPSAKTLHTSHAQVSARPCFQEEEGRIRSGVAVASHAVPALGSFAPVDHGHSEAAQQERNSTNMERLSDAGTAYS